MSRQRFVPRGDAAMRPESVGLTWPRAPVHEQKNEWGPPPNVRGGVAVIDVCGPLEHHGGWWFDSYEKILGRVEGAFRDDDVHTVLLNIDSPGGEVSGLQETVRKIRSMRASYDKPLIAYANDEAYSAAYALACSADEIYLPEGGGVGSIGVLAELHDQTKMAEKAGVRVEVVRSGNRKAEGHPFIPLTDETIGRVQVRVDDLADQFFALVCDVRPTTPKRLQSLQGACLYGQVAVDEDLADGVASFDEVLSSFSEESFDNDSSSSVLFKPTDRSVVHGDLAMFKVLEKKVAAALAALADTSLSASARKKATAVYAAALTALTEAKVKKTYEKKTTETETEEDDGEKDDTDDDDDGDEPAAEVKDDEDEEKAAKATKALAAFAKTLTGQSSSAAAQEVLASMHEQAQLAQRNAAEIAQLKADAAKSKLKAMIAEGSAAGKLKPAQFAWARTQSVASLKAYLEATPAMFSPRQGAIGEVVEEVQDSDGLTEIERDVCMKTGMTVEAYKKQRDSERGPQLPKVN